MNTTTALRVRLGSTLKRAPPTSAAAAGDWLVVADSGNNRVLWRLAAGIAP